MNILGATGAQFRERRLAAGLSQSVAAERAKVGRSTLIHFEQGRKDVRLSNVLALAAAIGASFGMRAESPEHAERVHLRSQEAMKMMSRRHAHARIALDLALRRPPALRALVEARSMVTLWKRHRTCSEHYIDAWSRILRGKPGQVAARLHDIDPRWIDALLQNTPFPGSSAGQ
jgi:transcriptional regulator with XRE-family HTH domain